MVHDGRLQNLIASHAARCVLACLLVVLTLPLAGVVAAEDAATNSERSKTTDRKAIAFFETKIRPVLIAKCYSCHSQQAAKARKLKGKLLVDSKAGLLAGGESGPAVVPGQPAESLLIDAIRHESFEMPPEQPKLSDRVIADFVRWIEMGAPDPRDGKAVSLRALELEAGRKHWAFLPLANPMPPEVKDNSRIRTPVDRFILAKLKEKSLTPAPQADRHTLVRRVYFDLIGLPPTPQQVRDFVNDKSPNAYEDLVDQLLDSPHYGERWARHWLDAARFGETTGSNAHNNDVLKDAYKYRDAVIKALNEDLPYNEFVAYQVAGRGPVGGSPLARDLAQFPHLGTSLQPNVNPNEKMFHRLDDIVSATGSAFLGLTIGCARCHDHKLDPITSEEYYRLTAVYFDQVKVEAKAKNRRIALEVKEPHLLAAGSWRRPVRRVSPGFVQVLMRGDTRSQSWLTEDSNNRPDDSPQQAVHPRHALAGWLTDVERGAGNLLARVIVNRIWQHHFGRGIVDTPNDFGSQGERPTHPKLLDWLAGELIRGGWRLKPMHRLIVNSAAYRQASSNCWAEVDQHNRWVWHYRTHRLDAEIIRDNVLAVSGALKTQLYGPSIPVAAQGRGRRFNDSPATWRRSIYIMSPRFESHQVLRAFDPVDNFQSVGVRTVSTTPSSALFLLNAPFVWQQAELMAARIEKEAGDELADQVDHVYKIAFARQPSTEERALGVEFLSQKLTADEQKGPRLLVHYCHTIIGLNEFIYVR